MQIHNLFKLTRVISLDAAAALICRLGWRTVLVQSRARAKVPTDLNTKGNFITVYKHLKYELKFYLN